MNRAITDFLGHPANTMVPIGTLAAALVFSSALLLAPQHANADITSNLIAHWTFDEGSGTVVGDSTVNGFDGELFDSNGWAAGHIGGAIDFTDSDARVIVPNMLGEPDVPLTISAWLNVTDRPGKGTYFALGGHQIVLHLSGATDGISIEYEGSGCDNFGFCQTNTTTDLESAGWKHVVAVIDPESSLQEIYIDGVLATTSTHSNTFGGYDFAPYEHVCIGSSYACGTGEGWQMDGLMDDLRVYDRALTQSDVEELYAYDGGPAAAVALSRPPNNLGLVGYWPMDEGTGTIAGDHSGFGNNGTLATFDSEIPLWTNGRFGKALDFVGDNHYPHVQTTFNQSLLPATIVAWVKVAAGDLQACDGAIFSRGTAVSGLNVGQCQDGTRLGYHWNNDGSAHDWTGGPLIPTDKWFLAAMVVESNQATLYAYSTDGQNSAVNSISHSASLIDNLRFGMDTNRAFNGQIDDVRIYNRALGASEIAALARGGAARIGASSVDLASGSSLEQGLVGHWTFDGKDTNWTSATAGTALDRSGNGNTGTLTSMNRSTSIDGGVLGQALIFDGSNDYVNVANQTPYNFERTDPFTLSAWIYPATVSDGSFLSKYAGFTGYYVDFVNGFNAATGQIVFGMSSSDNDAEVYSGFDTVTRNAWHHVVAINNGAGNRSGLTIYVDGVELREELADALGSNSIIVDQAVNIGAANDMSSRFTGRVDDARIYDRALTAAEVKQLYNLGQVKIVQ